MFENLGKKIAGFGNSVKQGTQNLTETFSLNGKIESAKSDINNCFTQLGQMYYEKNKENMPEEYRPLMEHILSQENAILQFQQQIREIKGIRNCPTCGTEVPADAVFCANCGTSVPPVNKQPEAPAQAPVCFCSNCGAKIVPGSAFCTECGSKL